MFNLQGSEIIFILLIALVVLGPEKLPGAIRRATQTYAELRKMTTSFQSEFKSAIDEPMREMRETADLLKDSADPKKIAEQAEREAEAAAKAEKKAKQARSVVESMEAAGAASLNAVPDLSLVSNDDTDDDVATDDASDVPETSIVDVPDEIDPFADPVLTDGPEIDLTIDAAREDRSDVDLGHDDDSGIAPVSGPAAISSADFAGVVDDVVVPDSDDDADGAPQEESA